MLTQLKQLLMQRGLLLKKIFKKFKSLILLAFFHSIQKRITQLSYEL